MDRFLASRGFTHMSLVALFGFVAGCSGTNGALTPESEQGTVDRNPPPGDSSPPPDPSPAPAGQPSVTLSSSDNTVGSGESVQLTWSSQNVDSCTASGGWTGTRNAQGSATVGPLNQGTTFSLTCSGAGGNAVAMLSVSVLGVISLSWEPPTENVDGSPLNDLAGYRIYYGSGSRDYTDQVAINSGGVTSQDVVLATGSYYFAMTAMDVDGNESGYSNEVIKTVN